MNSRFIPLFFNTTSVSSGGGGATGLPTTPSGFTALPLASGAQLIARTDSYGERGATIYNNGTADYGKDLNGSNLHSLIRAADRRFKMEYFINSAKPAGTYAAVKLDGSIQSVSGGGVHDTSFLASVDYALARFTAPGIFYWDIMKNDVNTKDLIATIKANMTAGYNKVFAAKQWQVFHTQAVFRNGSTPGDWSSTGTELITLLAINDWIKNTVATWPGVAGIIDTTDLDGAYTVPNEARVFSSDKLHLLAYGNWQRLPRALTVLRTLVQPYTPALVSDLANSHPYKTLAGTNGSKASNVLNDPNAAIPGVAAGMRVSGTTGDTTYASKGTNSRGENTQIVKVTPANNGTLRHSVTVGAGASPLLFSTINTELAKNGQSALAPGDYCEYSFQCTLDDWAGWAGDDASNPSIDTSPPGSFRLEQTDVNNVTYWLETERPGIPNGKFTCRVIFPIATGADRFQGVVGGIQVYYLSNVGGTGTATFDELSFRKLTTNPKLDFNL